VSVDGGSPTDEAQREWQSAMIDVSEMSLADLAETVADTPLARSLRRLADEVANPGEPIAGFNSAL
jgi:FXSXX-COOH protein